MVGEVEARVSEEEVKRKTRREDGEGSEEQDGERRRLVAVLSFMRRVMTRVVRPPTLLQAAMQALAVANVKLAEGEVLL